jgi:hypothetical protein
VRVNPNPRLKFRKSANVSPTVVHKTFIIQKKIVTSGTLLSEIPNLFWFSCIHMPLLYSGFPQLFLKEQTDCSIALPYILEFKKHLISNMFLKLR